MPQFLWQLPVLLHPPALRASICLGNEYWFASNTPIFLEPAPPLVNPVRPAKLACDRWPFAGGQDPCFLLAITGQHEPSGG